MAASPLVGLIMGSRSDWETMRHAAETLDALEIPYESASSPPIAPLTCCSTMRLAPRRVGSRC